MIPEKDILSGKHIKICLLGASFNTGNMGVSALAESSIKCILKQWPDAQISLLGSGSEEQQYQLKLIDSNICIRVLPVRFCKNMFLPCHFIRLLVFAMAFKILRWKKFEQFYTNRNETLRGILEADLVADITGGDSFSDIYGLRRFILGFLPKWLVVVYGKKLVLLPQTYGPFNKRITKTLAKYILNHSDIIYSRDRDGVNYVRQLLNSRNEQERIRFLPDLAFVLDSERPEHIDIGRLQNVRTDSSIVVGLNVSGLLFKGGYTRNNMFGLKESYSQLIINIIDMLLKDSNVIVLLIPHVFPPKGYEIESDPIACSAIYESCKGRYKNQIFLTQGIYNQNQIKYVIGMCDFFIGSRMHACIAALSQNIPTVGLAYSQKWKGVFDSINLSYCTVDARCMDKEEILSRIKPLFICRKELGEHLKHIMPQIKENILYIFGY